MNHSRIRAGALVSTQEFFAEGSPHRETIDNATGQYRIVQTRILSQASSVLQAGEISPPKIWIDKKRERQQRQFSIYTAESRATMRPHRPSDALALHMERRELSPAYQTLASTGWLLHTRSLGGQNSAIRGTLLAVWGDHSHPCCLCRVRPSRC